MTLAPLSGFTIAVTADRRREEQVELLRRRGATVLEAPTVRTVPLVDDDALGEAIAGLIDNPPDVTVLTTGVGTRGLVAAAESNGFDSKLLAVLERSTVVARGPKAIGAAAAAGLSVGWRAPGETSSEVIDFLRSRAVAGQRIAVQRDGDIDAGLAQQLAELGADVIDVPVYRWQLPEDTAPATRLVEALLAGTVDAVTFTSSPAVRNLVAIAGDDTRRQATVGALCGPAVTACVGPVCARTARSLGIENPVVPDRSRLGTMIQALARSMAGQLHELRLAGADVSLQGGVAVVDGEHFRLSDRERAVLRVLVAAKGAVVPKRTLLREVWGTDGVDEHAVEVTVARLRRRLGTAADALETVPRRGYRLDRSPLSVPN